MRDGMAKVLAVAALGVALIVFLASTGPRPDAEISSSIRRDGGVCLSLERWSLFGWQEVGRAYSVSDIQNGRWHGDDEGRQCAQVTERTYLVRPPFDAPNGAYRICGLEDANGCLEFEIIDFVSDGPGP